MTRIAAFDHKLFTIEQKKISLSPFNDKLYMTREGNRFMTKAFGHYTLMK